jgi:hypothetical protein
VLSGIKEDKKGFHGKHRHENKWRLERQFSGTKSRKMRNQYGYTTDEIASLFAIS